MRSLLLALFLSFGLFTCPANAQDPHEADRKALVGILADIEKGINAGDIELMAKHIDDKAIVTWLNAEVSHGPDGVRDYFRRMVGSGPGTILSKYETHPKIAGPAMFYGDIAVAHGTTADEFTPHHRSVFRFDSRWTTTLRKANGQWKIVSLNLSTNTFNNVLTQELERYTQYVAIGGFIAGLAVMAGIGWWRCRKRARA